MKTEPGIVRLRPVVASDRDLIRAIEDEPAGNAMANVISRTDAQAETHWSRVLDDPDIVTRVIEFEEDGSWSAVGFVTSFIATVPLSSDREGEGVARRCIGYRIGQAWWGRRITTRALRTFLDDVMHERPLWANTAAANEASQRMLSRCGFEVMARRWSDGSDRYPAGDEVVWRLV